MTAVSTLRLSLLILLVPSVLGAAQVDPALRGLLEETARIGEHGTAARTALPLSLESALSPAEPARVGVFVELEHGRAFPLGHVTPIPLGETLCSAHLSLAEIRMLLDAPGVASVRLARPMQPVLDRSNTFLGVSRLRSQNLVTGALGGLTGRGVIVGIVDSGIDWSHPDFDDESGNTRILYYWDQTGQGWLMPEDYGFGSEFTPFYIDRGIAAGFDQLGHGTHVLGIAAGNGAGSWIPGQARVYAGVAPEASIVAVKTDFTDLGVAVGAFYIMDRATSLGMPVVVNLSVGSAFGPHRGTTPVELAMQRMSGPGKIIVAAAGNEGDKDHHAELRLAAGEMGHLSVDFPAHERQSGFPAYVAFEGWFPADNRYRFTLRNPSGQIMTRLVLGDQRPRVGTYSGRVRGWYAEDLGLTTLFLEIEDTDVNPGAAGIWIVDIEALQVGSDAELDFWVVASGRFGDAVPGFLDHLDIEETVLGPASAPGVVAVGAVSTRSCWTDAQGKERCYVAHPAAGSIAPFSALGPMSDGRPKPELLAPGYGVISARSSTISDRYFTAEEMEILSVPGHRYWVLHGTSMAAPQVTGTAALLLSRYPTLTPAQLVGRLTARAEPVVDPRTGRTEAVLRTWDAAQPVVALALAEATVEPSGHRVAWLPTKAREPARYFVHRAFAPAGPYHPLTAGGLTGEGQMSVMDRAPEPGRAHYYRIVAEDGLGLTDELDTLVVVTAGTARSVLLGPEPNPARTAATVRFLAAPYGKPGFGRLDVVGVDGRWVTQLPEVPVRAEGGIVEATWDLRDAAGRRVGAGVYFLRFAVLRDHRTTETAVKRLVVLPP